MMMKRLLFLLTVLLSGMATMWAQSDNTSNSVYCPLTEAYYNDVLSAFNAIKDNDATELEIQIVKSRPKLGSEANSRITIPAGKTLTIKPMIDGIILTAGSHNRGNIWFLNAQDNSTFIIGDAAHNMTIEGYGFGDSNVQLNAVCANEKKGVMQLTNLTFSKFRFGTDGSKYGYVYANKSVATSASGAHQAYVTMTDITITYSTTENAAFINNINTNNDAICLKGAFNIEHKDEGKEPVFSLKGRIKLGDKESTGIYSGFTAENIIDVVWGGNFAEGTNVIVKVPSSAKDKFHLVSDEWTLGYKASSGDLYISKPAEPTAKIGETTYADLTAALAAVQDGETITLLDNQEISNRVDIKDKAITIDGGNFTIKRASSMEKHMFLTAAKTAETGKDAELTLMNVTLDGNNIAKPAIEASNSGITTLNGVTIVNIGDNNRGAIENKSNGKVVLQGAINIPSIFVGKNLVVKATGAAISSVITLITDNGQNFKMIVDGGTAANFTNTAFRLSQQPDGVYAMPLAVDNSFSHPALLHTAADITAVKSKLTTGLTAAAWQNLKVNGVGTAYTSSPVEYLKRMDKKNWEAIYPDYSNFTNAANDAKAAYQLALRYQLGDEADYAAAAVNVLNAWATTNKGIFRLVDSEKNYTNNIPDPNEYLILIQAYQFANAAELLKGYNGWAAADQAKFNTWMKETFADFAIIFLENHHGNANPLHYWLNWDLAALNALVSVGVLTNDKALVDYALNYVDNGTGTGNKDNAIVAVHQDADSDEALAQCQESGRDQGHSTLDVTLMGVLCQMTQNSGANTDLWTAYNALEMAEYVGKYNLKDATSGDFVYDNVPFTTYNNGEVEHTVLSADQRGNERPCWELFHAYAKASNKADAYTEAWVKYFREKNPYGEGASDTTDELGFGTLMFGAEVTPTGIANVRSKMEDVRGDYFNLNGQRIAQPTKGLYIVNGKKVIVK